MATLNNIPLGPDWTEVPAMQSGRYRIQNVGRYPVEIYATYGGLAASALTRRESLIGPVLGPGESIPDYLYTDRMKLYARVPGEPHSGLLSLMMIAP